MWILFHSASTPWRRAGSGLQTHRSWVETRVHSKMGEPGFEHGLEGERDRQGVHLHQAVGEEMQRRKIFFQSRRKLLRTLRKEYDFTIRGRAYGAGVARAGLKKKASMVCCGASTKYSQDLWEERVGQG